MNADGYSITVRQVRVDNESLFEATVKEFPDILVLEEDQIAALDTARSLVAASLEILQEIGATVPAPIQREVEYSGRVTLRLPKSLHRYLAEAAEEEESSLNQHIVNVLIEQSATSRTRREVTLWHPQRVPTVHAPAKRGIHLRVVKETHYAEPAEWSKAK